MDNEKENPLEWWEEIQIDIIENLGLKTEAEHYRKHPNQWRAVRSKLNDLRNRGSK